MTFFIVLALLQVIAGTISGPVPRSLPGALSYPRTSNEVPKNASTQLTRKRRCLGTIISLLWPQVVGPVDEGIIAERGFDEIPKTLLEYHLDRIRKKAKEEEMNRLAVRAYMQKRLEKMNQVDFPNFHGNRLSFVDLFHRIRYFMGFSKSTVISWQHFPRSTSSRSRCDDSSMEPNPAPSLFESSCKAEEEERQTQSSIFSSERYPITKSISQLNAEHYLKLRHVFEFFNYLIGHLVCAEPDDPVEYLMEILDRCLRFRDCYGEEPLLFSKHHIKSLYDTFDPYDRGFITVDQYEVAMDNIGITRGLTPNNPNPPVNESGKVDKGYFLNEAHRCLRENLKKMIRVPKDWEENRVLWQRVMLRKNAKQGSVRYCTEEEQLGEHAPEAQSVSEFEAVKEVVCPATSPCSSKMRHEPEQLFLTG